MKSIWKVTLEGSNRQSGVMPVGAKILSLQVQCGVPVMWALAGVYEDLEQHIFATCDTGEVIPESCSEDNFVGTYLISGERRTCHVFDVTEWKSVKQV